MYDYFRGFTAPPVDSDSNPARYNRPYTCSCKELGCAAKIALGLHSIHAVSLVGKGGDFQSWSGFEPDERSNCEIRRINFYSVLINIAVYVLMT